MRVDVHVAKSSRTAPNTKAGQEMAEGKSLPEIAQEETDVVEEEFDNRRYSDDPCAQVINSAI